MTDFWTTLHPSLLFDTMLVIGGCWSDSLWNFPDSILHHRISLWNKGNNWFVHFSAIKLNQMKYEYLNVYTLFTVYYIFPILSKLHVVFLDRYRCKQNLAIKSLVNLYTNSYYWIHRWQNIWEYWVES